MDGRERRGRRLMAQSTSEPTALLPEGRRAAMVMVRGRDLKRAGAVVGTQITAFLLAMGLLILILWAIHYHPGQIISSLWSGSVGSNISLGTSLDNAMPLVLAAVAIWVAFQG